MSSKTAPPRLGLNRWDWRSPEHFAASVALAETLGWGDALLPTNPLTNFDTYVMLASAATQTARIRLAPFLDNPVLRHPAVLAGAITTVDEVSGGRARLVLGVGDTAVRFLGLRPAKVAELEAAVSFCRRLLAGDRVDVGTARPARLFRPAPIPVEVAAGGPLALRMAGRTADGVYLRVGRDPMNLQSAVENLQAGAADAGRNLDDVTVGLVLHTITSQNPKEIAAISRSMAAGFYEYSPALFEMPGITWDGPPIEELKQTVAPDFHHARDLVAAGQVVGFLPDRAAAGFSLFGTPRDIADQLRAAIDSVGGKVDIVVPHPVPMPAPDSDYPRWFIEEVWPLVV
jgi:5,10-methylenetetrahydromethanopterin reductase